MRLLLGEALEPEYIGTYWNKKTPAFARGFSLGG